MNIKEFREFGYLQELNRVFLHPLGLALEVRVLDEDEEILYRIVDSRHDPEGIIYAELDDEDSREKESRVKQEWETRQSGSNPKK